MERAKIGWAADEAALIAVIASEAGLAGWTVISAGTNPAGTTWFKSLGENGYLNIVGALAADTVPRFVGYAAADLDTFGLVGGGVSGYTSNDIGGAGTPVWAKTVPSALNAMPERLPPSGYAYRMAIDRDAIRVLVDYTSTTSAPAQAVLYIGTLEPTGDELETQAVSIVDSVAPGAIAPPGTSVQITLKHDITAALKDTGPGGAAYPNDPAQQRLFFQVIMTGATPLGDAFKVERAPAIVPSSLTTVGGKTRFEIPLPVGATTKLFQQASAQRYAAGRGAGDLVRLYAQPTVCIVSGSNTEATRPILGVNDALAAWDPFGGQRGGANPISFNLVNKLAQNETFDDPETVTLRTGYYRMYLVMPLAEQETGIIPHGSEGAKAGGALVGTVMVPNASQPNFSIFVVNEDMNRRYCMQERLPGVGMGPPASFGATDLCWAVGRGF